MKRDNKKALYESIMSSVAKEVKKALNENKEDYSIINKLFDLAYQFANEKCTGKNSEFIMPALNYYYVGVPLGYYSRREEMCKAIADNWVDNDKEFKRIRNMFKSLTNDCFTEEIVNNMDNPIILNKKPFLNYIYFLARSCKDDRTYDIFHIKLSEKGIRLIENIFEKQKDRQDSQYIEHTPDMQYRKRDFIFKKYGISERVQAAIRHMCFSLSYDLKLNIHQENELFDNIIQCITNIKRK